MGPQGEKGLNKESILEEPPGLETPEPFVTKRKVNFLKPHKRKGSEFNPPLTLQRENLGSLTLEREDRERWSVISRRKKAVALPWIEGARVGQKKPGVPFLLNRSRPLRITFSFLPVPSRKKKKRARR